MGTLHRAIWPSLMMALTLPSAWSGETKCTYPVQECLDEMVSYYKDRGWVGIEYDLDEKTGAHTILAIIPGSPAEAAGLRAGDVLVALDGMRYVGEPGIDKEKVARILVPGNTVTFTVLRNGRERDVRVALDPMTEEVLAQIIGRHMLERHQATEAAGAESP